jgi:hypothetical protein
MPRAVFWLLWETIKKGEPVGAYVKNKAKDGRYYWVFAIVTPVEGGYLSVRFKPSGPHFEAARNEYAALAAAETEERLSPAEGGQRLLSRLKELGFEDYGAFMSTALSAEFRARDEKLGRTPDPAAINFDGLAKTAGDLLTEANAVYRSYASHRNVPLNLSIQAARLGQAGATIGVIAKSYGSLSDTINASMTQFILAARKLVSTINKGLFLCRTSQIQKEMSTLFQQECSTAGNSDLTHEVTLLETQRASYENAANNGLHEIAVEAQHFDQHCFNLRRSSEALETTHIMGKLECARIGSEETGLDALLRSLEEYQTEMAQGLQKMKALNGSLLSYAQDLFRYRLSE